MSVSKELELRKCFVCFNPTEKFGATESTFLSVVMLLRMEGHLPYPPNGSPVLIKDWDPCEPCVPKTLDLYKEYVKLQKKIVKRRRKVREEIAIIADTVISSSNKYCEENDDGKKENKNAVNEEPSKRLRVRRNSAPSSSSEKVSPKKKGKGRTNKEPGGFKCPRCPTHFTFKDNMARHFRNFHEKKKWKLLQKKKPVKVKMERRRRVKDVIREEMATIADTVISLSNKSSEENDIGRKEKKKSVNKETSKRLQVRRNFTPTSKKVSPKKKGNGRTSKEPGDFKCPRCPTHFTFKVNVTRHMRDFHEKKKGSFKCPHCRSSFVAKYKMTRHITAVHEKLKPFKCPKCPLTFFYKQHLQRHIPAHVRNESLKCPHCPSSFQLSGALSRHLYAAHTSNNEEAEETPQQNVVTKGTRPLNRTNEDSSLSTGRKTRRNKERLKCPLCRNSFKTNCYLQRHIRTVHEGVRPFKCPHCVKSFTQSTCLRDHVAIVHEGRVLYKCPRPNCKSTFAHKHAISLHVAAVHEKRKDFKCPICRKGFSIKSNCTTHVIDVHGKS